MQKKMKKGAQHQAEVTHKTNDIPVKPRYVSEKSKAKRQEERIIKISKTI